MNAITETTRDSTRDIDSTGRKKIAIVATAHYLAWVMWAMLKHGTLWKEPSTALAV